MNETERARGLPPPSSGLLLFAAVLVSNVAFGYLFSTSGLDEDWLAVATPVVVLFWTAVFVWLYRVDLKETLLLRLPSTPDLLMALPLAISFVVLSDQLSSLTAELVPKEVEEFLIRLVRASTPLEWLVKVTTIGVGAAVSEELMFRGFIQNAFTRSMRGSSAVIWTSFLFLVLHGILLPSVAAAGLVLGFAALATRSILVPIVIHFINNAAALALVNLTDLRTLGDPVWTPPEILLPAGAIFVLTMGYYARRFLPFLLSEPGPSRPSEEEDRVNGEARLQTPDPPSTLREELSSLPARKRRLGWLAVGAAILLGSLVLLGLFGYTLYWTNPQAVHAAFIEALARDARESLAPDASHREEDLEIAFEALGQANEEGSLTGRQLARVIRAFAESNADGRIHSEEVDAIVGTISRVVSEATVPRRL